jgi:hypothetical protein
MIENACPSNRRFSCRRGLLWFCLFVTIAAAAFALEPAVTERIASEYEVKAAYLFNFAKFIEWPAPVFPKNDAPIIIGISKDDSFGGILENAVSGKTVQNRSIIIRRVKTLDDWQSCNIAFIGAAETNLTASILESLESRHVLTVGEREGTARSKCIINFIMEGGRVQFEVDAMKAEIAGIKISSKLMMVARVVNRKATKGRE